MTLKVNYRTSHQIRSAADRLLPKSVRDVDGLEDERAGTVLGTVQAALNPGRAGLLRAQVAEDVTRIRITYLGPADLASA